MPMYLVWFKAFIGFLLMLSFSLPLAFILGDFSIPEEPMLLLILNMTLADYLFGSTLFMMAMADVIHSEDTPLPLCASVQYLIFGAGLASKTSTLFLAVDQFVGVVHPLRHEAIMGDWKNTMVAISWCSLLVSCFLGFVAYQLDLETGAESSQRKYGLPPIDECRLSKISEVWILAVEAILFLLAVSSAALYVYTAVQGMKQERRDARRGEVDQTTFFFLRFKSFKRIVKILLSLLVLDIVGSIFWISLNWYHHGAVMQIFHLLMLLSLVVEGWTYDLQYPAVHAAFRKFFGWI